MKRILFFAVLAVAVLSMVHSVESVYSLWQKRDIILQTQKEVQEQQEEHAKLTAQLHVISQASFVEEEARNKLFMSKPGEKMVFIPGDAFATSSAQTQVQHAALSNWEAWWRLFF